MAYRILRYMFSCLIRHVRPMVYTHRAIGCERANLWFKALNSTPARKGDWKSHANFFVLPTFLWVLKKLYITIQWQKLYITIRTPISPIYWPFLYNPQNTETHKKTLHNYPFPIYTNEKKSGSPWCRRPGPSRSNGQKLTAKVTQFTWQTFETVIQY